MDILPNVLLFGITGAIAVSAVVLGMIWYNPRLMLQDYPEDVRQAVPAKTKVERRLSAYWGRAFMLLLLGLPVAASVAWMGLFATAFGVLLIFNLVDWLSLDWLIFCTVTPKFAVIPGTVGMAGYKRYAPHARGFLIGVVFSVIAGIVIATVVSLW